MLRNWALVVSVFTAAVVAHPSWERPFHGPPSDDVAEVLQLRTEYLTDLSSPEDFEVDCRQAPAKRVYHCDVDAFHYEDAMRFGYRVTVLR